MSTNASTIAHPLPAVAGGAVAGAVGTLAMDLLWYRRYRRGGGGDGFAAWELSAGTAGFDQVGAPGKLGRKLANAFLHRDPPRERAGLVNDAVHWATGSQWGAVLGAVGVLAGRRRGRPVPGLGAVGPLLGAAAFATAYAVLPRLGLYQPISEYDRETLRDDLTAHLVFGTATGAAYALIESLRRRI